MAERNDRWPGGFVRYDANGRGTYWIRRQVGGKRYELSTRCTTLRAAMVELERFEADPIAYEPGGPKRAEPLHLTGDLGLEFLEWSKAQGNSDKWLIAQQRYVQWWAEKLEGADLRTCGAGPIRTALTGATARQHRIAVIKRFCAWLVRERELLRPEQNPTATLTVPQARPEQWRREKAIPRAHFLRVRELVGSPWRDALDLLAGTGWHLTEMERFAVGGEILESQREGEAAVLLCPRAKSGAPHRTAVSAEVAAAAKRLREHGKIRGDTLHTMLDRACKAAGVEPLNPGSMRHSVATWAIEAGADPAAVAAFLGHASPTTTRRFYATHAAAPKVPTLL